MSWLSDGFDFGSGWNAVEDVLGGGKQEDIANAGFENQQQMQQSSQDFQKEMAENYNPHTLLNNWTDGGYSEYMQNYAFQDPTTQGQQSREQMEAMFPELNPWELAGTPSAGVAGAMGQNANAEANKTAGASSQLFSSLANNKTQMDTATMQAKTQRDIAVINNKTDLMKTAINSATSLYQNKENIGLGEKELENKQWQTSINMEKSISDMDVNHANIDLISQKTSNAYLESANIKLNSHEKIMFQAQYKERLQAQLDQQKYGNSQQGKQSLDFYNIAEDVVNEVSPSAAGRAASAAPFFAKGLLPNAFSTSNKNSHNGVKGATSNSIQNKQNKGEKPKYKPYDTKKSKPPLEDRKGDTYQISEETKEELRKKYNNPNLFKN